MLRHVPIPPDLQDWLEAAVHVNAPAGLDWSHYPAMLSSMLVLRLCGEVVRHDGRVPPAAWISASRTAQSYRHQGAVRAVGVVLRPETAACLFPVARGLVDRVLPLDALLGPGDKTLAQARDPISNVAQDDEACLLALFQLVRRALTRQPDAAACRRDILALMAQACRKQEPDAAAPGSRRRLERRFAALLGMSPKQFQLIARHNATLQEALIAPARPGVELALDAGYCDQSHMTRDMRRFAGHPLEVLRDASRPGSHEHWPLVVGAQARQVARGERRR